MPKFKKQADEVNPALWKTMDLQKHCAQDLEAAISMLTMIKDNPELFGYMVKGFEDFRQKMIRQEADAANNDLPGTELKP